MTRTKQTPLTKLIADTRRYVAKFPHLCDRAFWMAFVSRVEELWDENAEGQAERKR